MTTTAPERIEVDYLIETAFSLVEAAEAMAGEQSSGTFLPISGETPELKERSAARIERLEEVEDAVGPSLPGAAQPKNGDGRGHRARVTLSWPIDNIGPSLPNLLATVAGNLFELRQFSGLRIEDIRLPAAFAEAYPGPKFGVEGTRRLSQVADRPLIGTIVKPSIGYTPEETADMVARLSRPGSISSRMTSSVGRRQLPLRRSGARGDAGDQRARRTDRQEGHVRLQYHRRAGPDAPAARPRRGTRRDLHHGEPELRWHGGDDRASVMPGSRSMRTAMVGESSPPSAAGLVLRRLAETLARAGADHMHVNGTRTSSARPTTADRLRPGLPDPDVGGQALHRDAGLFLRAVGAASTCDIRPARLDRPHICGGRRRHGPPRRTGRRCRHLHPLGTRRYRACLFPSVRATTMPSRGRSRSTAHEHGTRRYLAARGAADLLVWRRLHRVERGRGGTDFRRPAIGVVPRHAIARTPRPLSGST